MAEEENGGGGGSGNIGTGGIWKGRDGSGGNIGRGGRARWSVAAETLKRVQETPAFLGWGLHRRRRR